MYNHGYNYNNGMYNHGYNHNNNTYNHGHNYNMNNIPNYYTTNNNITPNDEIIGKELFYELRNRLILHPMNPDSSNGPIMQEKFKQLTGYTINALATEIIQQYPDVIKYIQNSWRLSSYENKMHLLSVAYNIIYSDDKFVSRIDKEITKHKDHLVHGYSKNGEYIIDHFNKDFELKGEDYEKYRRLKLEQEKISEEKSGINHLPDDVFLSRMEELLKGDTSEHYVTKSIYDKNNRFICTYSTYLRYLKIKKNKRT